MAHCCDCADEAMEAPRKFSRRKGLRSGPHTARHHRPLRSRNRPTIPHMEKNDLGMNSLKNLTAMPDEGGGATVHFGGCEDGRKNCIPITDGWNYIVRLYQPRQEILDGTWTFPAATIAK